MARHKYENEKRKWKKAVMKIVMAYWNEMKMKSNESVKQCENMKICVI